MDSALRSVREPSRFPAPARTVLQPTHGGHVDGALVEALQMENAHLRQKQQRVGSALRRTQQAERELLQEVAGLRAEVCRVWPRT